MKIRINREFFKENGRKALNVLKKATIGAIVVSTITLSGCGINADRYSDETPQNSPVYSLEDTITNTQTENYREFLEYLDSMTVEIPYSGLFNVEHLIDIEDYVTPVMHRESDLLNGTKIDAEVLYQKVLKNNAKIDISRYELYKIAPEHIRTICRVIADALNAELESNQYADIDALLCNLESLTIFAENGSTNARVTNGMALLITKSEIDILQNNIDSNLDAFKLTIEHESMHLLQINCSDEIDKTEGNRIGFNRKWKNEPINSLFWSWYYEASAEMLTAERNGIDNIVYESETNYLKYLKTTLLLDPHFDIKSLEEVSVSRDSDDFYSLFGASTREDKVKIAQMMYAIELVQSVKGEFEEIYMNYTGLSRQDIDYAQITSDLKCGVSTNLSVMFFKNLVEYIRNYKPSLDEIYYIISIYEKEVGSFLGYSSSIDSSRTFIESYLEMEDNLFNYIATEYGYTSEYVAREFDAYEVEDEFVRGLTGDKNEFLQTTKSEIESVPTIRKTYEMYSQKCMDVKTLTLNMN